MKHIRKSKHLKVPEYESNRTRTPGAMADSPVAWELLKVTADWGKMPTQFRDERFDRLDAPPRKLQTKEWKNGRKT